LQKYYKNFKLTITANWITGMNSYKRNLTEKSAKKRQKKELQAKHKRPNKTFQMG
jgi:hypothetical protein